MKSNPEISARQQQAVCTSICHLNALTTALSAEDIQKAILLANTDLKPRILDLVLHSSAKQTFIDYTHASRLAALLKSTNLPGPLRVDPKHATQIKHTNTPLTIAWSAVGIVAILPLAVASLVLLYGKSYHEQPGSSARIVVNPLASSH